jgi:ATP-dependent protease Clp ATPase subunit
MTGKEEVTWLDLYAKPWQQRWRHYIGELPQLDDGKLRSRLTSDQLQFCPPRVLGFAVSQKKFVQLLVENVHSNISQKDKEKPWHDFKLKGKDKETLRNLVTQHAKSEVIEDVIRGKGKGLVVLLHGPPGVGKTLSAESLAILTDKPLYSVSMADIGLSPRTVESNLRRIFELATHWKAILLFDEADVFLEARSLEDVRRNSLVSTLLRILEYFQGELQMIYGIDICSHC